MATSAQLPDPGFPAVSSGPLVVHTRGALPVVHVTAVGEVDLASVRQLRQAVLDAVADGASEVVLDLTGVSFIDCTGVSVLLGCVDDATRAGASVSIGSLSPRVTRLLELTGTAQRLVPRG